MRGHSAQLTHAAPPLAAVRSIEAYKRYGVTRGSLLTAWRLLRCNPLGPSGYDPVAWPPPGLPARLFALPGSPELVLLLGVAAVLRLGHALLFE